MVVGVHLVEDPLGWSVVDGVVALEVRAGLLFDFEGQALEDLGVHSYLQYLRLQQLLHLPLLPHSLLLLHIKKRINPLQITPNLHPSMNHRFHRLYLNIILNRSQRVLILGRSHDSFNRTDSTLSVGLQLRHVNLLIVSIGGRGVAGVNV